MQLLQALLTAVLQGVLQTSGKIRHKLGDRPKDTLTLQDIQLGGLTYPLWATAPETP
jgi:hypothetical protein